jgi:hypothetical protein
VWTQVLLLLGAIWTVIGSLLGFVFLRAEIEPTGPSFIPFAFVASGLVALAVGLFRARGARDLYVNGLAVVATVTAVSPSVVRMNRQRVMNVDYEFDASGARQTGRTTALVPPAVGSAIWVVHAAGDPKKSVAVPSNA